MATLQMTRLAAHLHERSHSFLPHVNQPRRSNAGNSGPSRTTNLGIGLGIGSTLLIAVVIVAIIFVRRRAQNKRRKDALEVKDAIRVWQRHQMDESPWHLSDAGIGQFESVHAHAGKGHLAVYEAMFGRQSIRTDTGEAVPYHQIANPLSYLRNSGEESLAFRQRCNSNAHIPAAVYSSSRCLAGGMDQDDSESVNAQLSNMVDPNESSPKDVNDREQLCVSTRYTKIGPSETCSHLLPGCHLSSGAYSATTVEGFDLQDGSPFGNSTNDQSLENSDILIASPTSQQFVEEEEGRDSQTMDEVEATNSIAIVSPESTVQRPLRKSKRMNPLRPLDKEVVSLHAPALGNTVQHDRHVRSDCDSFNVSPKNEAQCIKDCSLASTDAIDRIVVTKTRSQTSVSSSVQKANSLHRISRRVFALPGASAMTRTRALMPLSLNTLDIPSHSLVRQCQESSATLDSGHSSNGDPFQWDSRVFKPSTWKRTSTGRGRQVGVHIPPLVPQIMAPPSPRSSNPSGVGGGVNEDDDDMVGVDSSDNQLASSKQDPQSATSSVKTVLTIPYRRSSLAPSSPTLAMWEVPQKSYQLPSPSESSVSISPARSVPGQSCYSPGLVSPISPAHDTTLVSPSAVQKGISPVRNFGLSRLSKSTITEGNSSSTAELVHKKQYPTLPPRPVSFRAKSSYHSYIKPKLTRAIKHRKSDSCWESGTYRQSGTCRKSGTFRKSGTLVVRPADQVLPWPCPNAACPDSFDFGFGSVNSEQTGLDTAVAAANNGNNGGDDVALL